MQYLEMNENWLSGKRTLVSTPTLESYPEALLVWCKCWGASGIHDWLSVGNCPDPDDFLSCSEAKTTVIEVSPSPKMTLDHIKGLLCPHSVLAPERHDLSMGLGSHDWHLPGEVWSGQEAVVCSLPQTQHGADDLDLTKAHAVLGDIFLGADLEL